jgi:signal transduction histidine kinase
MSVAWTQRGGRAYVLSDDHNDHPSKVLLRQQTAIAKFGELALRSDDLDEILTQACYLVGEALGTDLSKVVEFKDDGRTLLVHAGVGRKSDVVGVATIEATDETSEGAALKVGEPIISPDIGAETRFRYAPFLIDNGVEAVANVVIMGHGDGRPFGILQVDSRHPRHFDDNDTAFLRIYANLIAAAVIRLQADAALKATVRELAEANSALESNSRELIKANAALEANSRELAEANAKLLTEAVARNRIAEMLRQSQKMEVVGQLTGGLAHDFNNHLTVISSSLELLRDHVLQGPTPDLDRYIEPAIVSTNRAATLTHRLLAFSRRQTLDPKVTDLNRLVESIGELFHRTVGPSIEIEAKLATDLWPVLCDPYQFENALLNLVINARDAMPDGGRLTIETSNMVMPKEGMHPTSTLPADFPCGDCVALAVSDTGLGMSGDVMARAFLPFFTTKPVGVGTGLGLSIIYGFVHQSGGDVRLRSEEGQGTTVSIYLPRHQGPVVPEPEVDVVAAPLVASSETGHVILVVEDEETILANIVEVFSGLGYTMLEVNDGASGLTVVDTHPEIDLLITDVGLPGAINGRQLADAARQARPNLKVLFITGYAEGVLVDRALEHGMQVMTKPFTVNALVAKVQEMLND